MHERKWHKAEDLLRRSDSFRFLRSFYRANEATAMPLDDLLRKSHSNTRVLRVRRSHAASTPRMVAHRLSRCLKKI